MSNKILNINFSGASSTGKSTLCQHCAEIYHEPFAPERMRDVMIKRGIGIEQITNDVFIEAADLQKHDMKKLENQAQKYLFTDSGPLIFYLGNKYSFGREFPELKDRALDFYNTQDVVFLCDPNIAFDDSIMRGDVGTKDILHHEIIKFMDNHDIKYNLVFGSVAERAEQVKAHLDGLEKKNVKSYEELYTHFPQSLKIIAQAYCETNVSDAEKKEALYRIQQSLQYLTASEAPGVQSKPECFKIIKELSKLREKGILGQKFEIHNFDLFKNSDLVKFSAGLGKFRNLTETATIMKYQTNPIIYKNNNQR